MSWLYIALALAIGACLSAQAGVNSQLPQWTGHPVRAALASFAVGTVALLVASLALRAPWPPPSRLAGAPWWAWSGGLLGAVVVSGTIVAAPRLGAALAVGLVVLGQLPAALFLDHCGVLGFPQHTLSLRRVLGAVLLVAGVVTIRRY